MGKLRQLIERVLPWYDAEQEAKSAARSERVLERTERVLGILADYQRAEVDRLAQRRRSRT